MRLIEEHVSPNILLRNRMSPIDNLVETEAIGQERFFFSALPIRLTHADGAPARIVSLDM